MLHFMLDIQKQSATLIFIKDNKKRKGKESMRTKHNAQGILVDANTNTPVTESDRQAEITRLKERDRTRKAKLDAAKNSIRADRAQQAFETVFREFLEARQNGGFLYARRQLDLLAKLAGEFLDSAEDEAESYEYCEI